MIVIIITIMINIRERYFTTQVIVLFHTVFVFFHTGFQFSYTFYCTTCVEKYNYLCGKIFFS
jgi:hypothetical protein